MPITTPKLSWFLLPFLAIALLVLGSDVFNKPSFTEGAQTSAPSSTILSEEAVSAARRDLAMYWTLLDDSYYAEVKSAIPPHQSETEAFVQMKRPADPVVQASILTDADKLNGCEWRGVVAFEAAATRRFDVWDDDPSKWAWSDYEETRSVPFFSLKIDRRNGNWVVRDSSTYPSRASAVKAERILSLERDRDALITTRANQLRAKHDALASSLMSQWIALIKR